MNALLFRLQSRRITSREIVPVGTISREVMRSKLEDAAKKLDLPLEELGEEENDDGDEGADDEE